MLNFTLLILKNTLSHFLGVFPKLKIPKLQLLTKAQRQLTVVMPTYTPQQQEISSRSTKHPFYIKAQHSSNTKQLNNQSRKIINTPTCKK